VPAIVMAPAQKAIAINRLSIIPSVNPGILRFDFRIEFVNGGLSKALMMNFCEWLSGNKCRIQAQSASRMSGDLVKESALPRVRIGRRFCSRRARAVIQTLRIPLAIAVALSGHSEI
jgi:hypothetical protein